MSDLAHGPLVLKMSSCGFRRNSIEYFYYSIKYLDNNEAICVFIGSQKSRKSDAAGFPALRLKGEKVCLYHRQPTAAETSCRFPSLPKKYTSSSSQEKYTENMLKTSRLP